MLAGWNLILMWFFETSKMVLLGWGSFQRLLFKFWKTVKVYLQSHESKLYFPMSMDENEGIFQQSMNRNQKHNSWVQSQVNIIHVRFSHTNPLGSQTNSWHVQAQLSIVARKLMKKP